MREDAQVRAAIYCRISQDKTGEAAGVTRQLEDCQNLVTSLGWELVETFIDNDVSATSGKVRPQFKRMLAGIEAGLIDAIVTWAPDRLYRKTRELEDLVDILEAHNTLLKTVRGGDFDMGTPLGRMIARILAATATGEGEVKADRWKRSVRQRREAGAMPGSGPRMYGWTREGKIIPEEAAVIRWAATQILEGVSLHSLVRQTEERTIVTSMGNPWSRQAMRQLLTNPRLVGHSTLNGEIVGTGQWEPILEVETWETVRALVTSSPNMGSKVRVALLAGMLYCGACGAPCVTSSRSVPGAGSLRVYRCTRDPKYDGCGKVSAAAEPVEAVVESYAQTWLDSPELRAETAAVEIGGDVAAEAHELTERIIELEAQLDQPGIPVAAILRAIDRAKERREEALARIVAEASVVLPDKGAPWPTDLDRRRRLVAVALQGKRVYLDRSTTRGRFDPVRVRIDPAP